MVKLQLPMCERNYILIFLMFSINVSETQIILYHNSINLNGVVLIFAVAQSGKEASSDHLGWNALSSSSLAVADFCVTAEVTVAIKS